MAVNVLYTRHKLTDEQMSDIMRDSENNESIIDCSKLAEEVIKSKDEAIAHVKKLLNKIGGTETIHFYGVMSVPLRWAFEHLVFNNIITRTIFVHEAFNINRAGEGEKPNFEFGGWLLTQVWNE